MEGLGFWGHFARWFWHCASAIFFSALGVFLFAIAYKLFDFVVPFDLNKELADNKNNAIGLVVCGVLIGLGLIIAAAIV